MSALWARQVAGILQLELRKNLFSMRALPVYLLAAIPVVIAVLMILVALVVGHPEEFGGPGLTLVIAGIYEFTLRFLVFFGCVLAFTGLFRAEVLDRSLHYYFLTPVRREVLVAGKFVAAWAIVSAVFVLGAIACMGLLYGYFGLATGAGRAVPGHLAAYVGLTVLACLGYGAVFLLIGLVFRNPLVPSVAIWLWENANPYLPSLLKKVSVIFYLQSLRPVPLSEGDFELLADPVPAWIGVPGLLAFAALVLVVTAWRIRRVEISYGGE